MIHLLKVLIKRDYKWLFGYFFILALGVFIFFLTHSLRFSIERSIKSKIQSSLGAELLLTQKRLWSQDQIDLIKDDLPTQSQHSQVTEFFTMAYNQINLKSKLANIKAIDIHFPLIGHVKLNSGLMLPQDHNLLAQSPTCAIDPALAHFLEVKVGDHLRLGNLEFTIIGFITDDSTQSFSFANLSPRIYINRDYFFKMGLGMLGATFIDSIYVSSLSTDKKTESLKSKYLKLFSDPSTQVLTAKDSSEQLSRPLQIVGDFLSLFNFGSLILAAIAQFYLSRLYISRRSAFITLLQTMGYTQGRTKILIFSEVLLVTIAANMIGFLASYLFLPYLSTYFESYFALSITSHIDWILILLLFTSNLGLSFLFIYPQLKHFNLASGFSFLTDSLSQPSAVKLPSLVKSLALCCLLFLAVAFKVAPSFKTLGIYFSAFFILGLLGFLMTQIAFKVLLNLTQPSSNSSQATLPSNTLTHKVTQVLAAKPLATLLNTKPVYKPIYKPIYKLLFNLILNRILRAPFHFGSLIMILIITYTLAFFLPFLKSKLDSEFRLLQTEKPNLFVFDVPDEDLSPLISLLSNHKLKPLTPSPLIRGRILEVNDKPFERDLSDSNLTREEEFKTRLKNRGINITIRDQLSSSEQITQGVSFDQAPLAKKNKQISLEQSYAQRLGLKLGDQLTLEIAGLIFKLEVTQIRKVKWNSFLPNFFTQIPSGILDEAPKIWLFSLKAPTFEQKVLAQNLIAQYFSSVTVLDVDQLTKQLSTWSNQFITILNLSSYMQMILSLLILAILIFFEKQTRKTEFSLYPFIGLNTNQIRLIWLGEFLTISLVTLIFSALGAWALTSSLFYFLFTP